MLGCTVMLDLAVLSCVIMFLMDNAELEVIFMLHYLVGFYSGSVVSLVCR